MQRLTGSGWFWRRLLGISPEQTTFARRGFLDTKHCVRERLERVGKVFVEGYHAALQLERDPEALARELNRQELEWRGFAFEGAAMGLSLLDQLVPWGKKRWPRFLAGPGADHVYMLHVGVGWALARLRRSVPRHLTRLDPLLGWLAVDGYGFHETYFKWTRYVERRQKPRRLAGYEQHVFDQGVGRALWFVKGADVEQVCLAISEFGHSRRGDLWSGVGLACTYTGGVERDAFRTLATGAGQYRPHLAQGAAFAAKARQKAGNPTPHTELACELLCGMPAEAAAKLTDVTLQNLSPEPDVPAYEIWRRRVQSEFGGAQAAEQPARVGVSRELS